jgi:DNA-binding helix-hairpin-helix protein with protein kinase domain
MFSFLQKINSKKASTSCNQLQSPSTPSNDHLKSSLPQNVKLNAKDSHLSSTLEGNVDFNKYKTEDKSLNGKNDGSAVSLSKFSLRKSFNLHQSSNSNNNNNNSNQSKNNFERKSHLSLASLGSGYFTTGRRFDKKKLSSTSLGIYFLILINRLFNLI